jgi:protein-S-isoprenylcysteine O-methyltransferase Ste14
MDHLLLYLLGGTALIFEAAVIIHYGRKAAWNIQEKVTHRLLIAASVTGTLGGFGLSPEARAAFFLPFNGVRYLGPLVIAAGVLLRGWTIQRLGDSFSIFTDVLPHARLKTDGLYRWIRHPSYSGTLLYFFGLALAFYHPLTSSLVLLLPGASLLYRIRVEEKRLIQHYGEMYISYRERSKRLIPFLY